VADEDDGFALRVDDAPGRGDITSERPRRVLDDADAVVALLQEPVALLPAGAVDETPPWKRTTAAAPLIMVSFGKGRETPAILRRAKHRVNGRQAWLRRASHARLDDQRRRGERRIRARAAPSRLAVSIRRSVTSDAEGKVPTGGELTLFEAVGRLASLPFVVSLVAGRGWPA
jgi:hypothetical protein